MMNKGQRRKTIFLGLALFALAGGVVSRARSNGKMEPDESAVARASRALPAKPGNENVTIPTGAFVAGNGVVEPAGREIRLQTTSAGRVAAVLVQEGDRVTAGQVLLRLEDARQKAALLAADADILVAQAELTRSLVGLRREDVEAALAEASAAQARAAQSQTTFERLQGLSPSGGVSREEIDRAQRTAEADKASADAAHARKRAALKGSRKEDLAIAHARLKVAEAGRARALADLAETEIRAPVPGEILQVKVRMGEYAAPGGIELLVMGDTRVLRARIDVDERDVPRLEMGAKGFVTLSAFPGQRFPARVVEIGKRMGRKNVRTDDPVERIDTKILETVVELEDRGPLVPGIRVVGYLEARGETP